MHFQPNQPNQPSQILCTEGQNIFVYGVLNSGLEPTLVTAVLWQRVLFTFLIDLVESKDLQPLGKWNLLLLSSLSQSRKYRFMTFLVWFQWQPWVLVYHIITTLTQTGCLNIQCQKLFTKCFTMRHECTFFKNNFFYNYIVLIVKKKKSYVMCHASHVTCHPPPSTPHVSPSTCH